MNGNEYRQQQLDLLWRGFLVIMIAVAVMYLPLDALAQTAGTSRSGSSKGSALDNAFCNVIGWFNGPIGKGIATIAIIVVGVGALMGKVSWGMAIIVGLGVALVFGATTVVNAIGGNGSEGCTTGGGGMINATG